MGNSAGWDATKHLTKEDIARQEERKRLRSPGADALKEMMEKVKEGRKTVPANFFVAGFRAWLDAEKFLEEANSHRNKLKEQIEEAVQENSELRLELNRLLETKSSKKNKLRDQLAMAALHAMGAVVFAGEYQDSARVAYEVADEMLEARQK